MPSSTPTCRRQDGGVNRRFAQLVLSCVVLGVGVALLLRAALGSDGCSTLINGLSLSLDVPFVAVNAVVGLVLVALVEPARHPRPWDDRAAGGGRLHRLRRHVLGR